MPLLLPALLAEAAPITSDPASAQSVGWILLGLAALATAANQILGLFERFKAMKAPEPGTVSEDRVKAIEDRVHAMELSVASSMGSITTQIENIKGSLTHIVSDFNYAIGRIDGRTEAGGGPPLAPRS